MSGERQVPFYCPYCGEESLLPAGPDAGDWECAACARRFQLRFVGVLRAPAQGPGTGRAS
jgi:predicted RNA-binding Zn-ribbon protein involved in translation (DUF1610 family)